MTMYADLVIRRRDGQLRAKKDRPKVRRMLSLSRCEVCGKRRLCAYNIVTDTLACSDECAAKRGGLNYF